MTRAEVALTALVDALGDLVTALRQSRADDVLRVEPRLDVAVAELRASLGTLPRGARPELVRLAHLAQDRIAQARRLGGTVPALLSVMFPGQVTYSRAGVRMAPIPRSGMAQVI